MPSSDELRQRIEAAIPGSTAVSDRHTTWPEPVRRIWNDPVPLDAIVIDNLPSLLPRQASEDFSAALVPLLPGLFTGDPVWTRAARTYATAIRGL